MIRFFRNNNPISFILLPLLALALWVSSLFTPAVDMHNSMTLYNILINPITNFHTLAILMGVLIVVMEAFFLNYIINEHEMLSRPSFLPALMYIIFMSCDTQLLSLYPVLFANFFILLAIHRIMSSYRKDTAFSNAFDAGLLFSIASLFYFPSIVLAPLLIIGFLLFRPFNWREWIISIIGIVVPYTFVLTYYFWNDSLVTWWAEQVFYPGRKQLQIASPGFYFMISICLFIFIISFARLFTGFVDASQKNRKGISLLIWLLVFTLLSIFLSPDFSLKSFTTLAIPAAVFTSNYFLKIRKVQLADFLFSILFIAIVINHVLSYLNN